MKLIFMDYIMCIDKAIALATEIQDNCEEIKGLLDKHVKDKSIKGYDQKTFIDDTYLCLLSKIKPEEIKFIVIGQDPFRKGAIGIPFLKRDKNNQVEVPQKYLKLIQDLQKQVGVKPSKKTTGQSEILELVDNGVVFLNSLYFYKKGIVQLISEIKALDTKDTNNLSIKTEELLLDLRCLSQSFNEIFIKNIKNTKNIYCLGQDSEHVAARALVTCSLHPAHRPNAKYLSGLSE